MAINTAVYGAESEWINYDNKNVIYFANFGERSTEKESVTESSLATANENGKLLVNTYDNSTTAVIVEGDFWGKYFTYFNNDFSQIVYNTPENANRLSFFGYQNPSIQYWNPLYDNSQNSYGWLGVDNVSELDSVYPDYYKNPDDYAMPVVKYNNKKIRWLITVTSSPADSLLDVTTQPLSDYLNYKFDSENLISRISFVPFVYDEINEEWRTMSKYVYGDYYNFIFGLTDNYRNINFYNSSGEVTAEKNVCAFFENSNNSSTISYDYSDGYYYYSASDVYSVDIFRAGRINIYYNEYTNALIGKIDEFSPLENEYTTTGNFTYKIDTDNNYLCFYYDTTTTTKEEFAEFCRKQCAFLGGFFSEIFSSYDENSIDKVPDDSEYLYLGTIEENGITRGNYTKGAGNLTNPSYNDDVISNIEKVFPEKITENDSGDLTSNTALFNFSGGVSFYELNMNEFNSFFDFINVGYRPADNNIFITDFKGKNPIDYITNVLIYPFDIPNSILPIDFVKTPLSIGGISVVKPPTTENVTAYPVTNQQFKMTFGALEIKRKFNDFRDYEPFTRAEIQLPFIGSYEIDLKKFYGTTLKVEYIVDVATGACTACIFRNDLLIDTRDGECGYTIALSGIAQGDYQNTIQRNTFNKKMSAYSLAGSAVNITANTATGNLSGTANSVLGGLGNIENFLQRDYELKHTAPKPNIISTADSLNSFYMDMRARLIFYHARDLQFNKNAYASTIGFACAKSGKIGDFTGYTVCSAVKLDNINCTATEKAILNNILTSGFYN